MYASTTVLSSKRENTFKSVRKLERFVEFLAAINVTAVQRSKLARKSKLSQFIT